MPFKSRSQLGKIASLEKQGKVKLGTFEEWLNGTPSVKKLPERVRPKKGKQA